LSRWILSN